MIRVTAECGQTWRNWWRGRRRHWRSVRLVTGDYGRPYLEYGLWFDGLGLIVCWPAARAGAS